MKITLSYRFTGEDPKELEKNLGKIYSTLEEAGHKVFCSFWKSDFFREHKHTNRQIMEYQMKEMDDSDILLVFIKSDDKSEGMLIELGYCLAKNKRIILAIQKGLETTFVRELANEIIEWENIEDLCAKLKAL